jgi:hypothetical protein
MAIHYFDFGGVRLPWICQAGSGFVGVAGGCTDASASDCTFQLG